MITTFGKLKVKGFRFKTFSLRRWQFNKQESVNRRNRSDENDR